MKYPVFSLTILLLISTLSAQQKNHTTETHLQASFQALGDLPGGAFDSSASRVSANGAVVVGNATTTSGSQAFRWTEKEGMVSLGNLPDGGFKQSWASGISADGTTIVGYGDPDGSDWTNHKGFRWTATQGMVQIPGTREARAVSADGSVIVGDGGEQAFRWTEGGGLQKLGVLPGRANSRAIAVSADGSVVTGSSYDLPAWDHEEIYVWTKSAGMQGLGLTAATASRFPNALSPDGTTIVGTSGASAFLWTRRDGLVSIPHLPGRRLTHPGGVSSYGFVVVGGSYVDRDHATAFIWDAEHGTRSLQSVLESECGLNLTGWVLESASDITPDGSVVVGRGKNPEGNHEAFRAKLCSAARSRVPR